MSPRFLAVLALVGCGGAADGGPAEAPWSARSWAAVTALQAADGSGLGGLVADGALSPGQAEGALAVDVVHVRADEGAPGRVALTLRDGGFDDWAPSTADDGAQVTWDAGAAEELTAQGASAAPPPVRVEALGEDAYRLTNTTDEPIDGALLLRKHEGGWLVWPQPPLPPGEPVEVDSPPPKERVAGVARERVHEALTALVDGAGGAALDMDRFAGPWGDAWIDRPGARLVVAAPPAWAAALLPVAADGAETIEHVVLARVEVFTPEAERALVTDLQAAKEAGDTYDAAPLGRFGAPLLRRAAAGEPELSEYVAGLLEGGP